MSVPRGVSSAPLTDFPGWPEVFSAWAPAIGLYVMSEELLEGATVMWERKHLLAE